MQWSVSRGALVSMHLSSVVCSDILNLIEAYWHWLVYLDWLDGFANRLLILEILALDKWWDAAGPALLSTVIELLH